MFIKEPHAKLVYIDPSCLTNILVLSVIGGSDHFIEISVDYVQTPFGARISDLVKITVPLAQLTTPIVLAARGSDNEQAVPKELWRVLDFIYTYGLHTPNLFVQSGEAAEVPLIRKALATGRAIDPDIEVHSVCCVLIELLASFYDPVLPVHILDEVCARYAKHGREDASLAQQFLASLSPWNFRVFIFLCSFLKSLAQQSDDFMHTAAKFASLFLEPLTQTEQKLMDLSSDDLQRVHLQQFHRQGFLLLFLLN